MRVSSRVEEAEPAGVVALGVRVELVELAELVGQVELVVLAEPVVQADQVELVALVELANQADQVERAALAAPANQVDQVERVVQAALVVLAIAQAAEQARAIVRAAEPELETVQVEAVLERDRAAVPLRTRSAIALHRHGRVEVLRAADLAVAVAQTTPEQAATGAARAWVAAA